MFQFKRLSTKLLCAFVLLGLAPLIFYSVTSYQLTSQALEEQSFRQLESIHSSKKSQIQDYFSSQRAMLASLKSDPHMQKAIAELIGSFHSGGGKTGSETWVWATEDYGPRIDEIVKLYQWDNFYVIGKGGNIVYTSEQSRDLGMNLNEGVLTGSGLTEIYQLALETRSEDVLMSDFIPYQPYDNEPASFMLTRIEDESGLRSGFIAYRIPLEQINKIMHQREGMGQTGETYLVGTDYLMRSDAWLDQTNHSVSASFSGSVEKNGVKTEALESAIQGLSGSLIGSAYNGKQKLTVYSPVTITERISWVLIAEIDLDEAFAAAINMRFISFGIVALCAFLVTMVAVIVARSISGPIAQASRNLAQIAEGDLTVSVDCTQVDEVGKLQAAAQAMVKRLHEVVTDISLAADEQVSQTAMLTVAIEKTRQNVSDQHMATDQVAVAINQMSATVDEVSRNTVVAAEGANEAKAQASQSRKVISTTVGDIELLANELNDGRKKVDSLEKDVKEIGGILDVIKGIADQTNLLALNAAIEAARAGESGRGFAVVADEVRTLAQNTQNSAGEIERMIASVNESAENSASVMMKGVERSEALVHNAGGLLAVLDKLEESVGQITDMNNQIASAAEEQSVASHEISRNASEIAAKANETGQSAVQITDASQTLTGIANKLLSQIKIFKL